jgi:hypothetical protein
MIQVLFAGSPAQACLLGYIMRYFEEKAMFLSIFWEEMIQVLYRVIFL